jgi:hypothetical protein
MPWTVNNDNKRLTLHDRRNIIALCSVPRRCLLHWSVSYDPERETRAQDSFSKQFRKTSVPEISRQDRVASSRADSIPKGWFHLARQNCNVWGMCM